MSLVSRAAITVGAAAATYLMVLEVQLHAAKVKLVTTARRATALLPRRVPPRNHIVAVNVVLEHAPHFTVVPIITAPRMLRLVVRCVDVVASHGSGQLHVPVTMRMITEDAVMQGAAVSLSLCLGDNYVELDAVAVGHTDVAPSTPAPPRIIHQTDSSRLVSVDCYNTVATILDFNPAYEYRFYDDAEAVEWLHQREGALDQEIATEKRGGVLEAYQWLEPGAYRADLLRYALLHACGGVYMDLKQVWQVPLDVLWQLSGRGLPFLVRDPPVKAHGAPGVFNAFMAAEAGCAVMAAALDQLVANVEGRHYGADPLDITGPSMLARVLGSERVEQLPAELDVPRGARHLSELHAIRLADASSPSSSPASSSSSSSRAVLCYKSYPSYYLERGNARHYSAYWRSRTVYQYRDRRWRDLPDDPLARAKLLRPA